jgi:Uma2 family endonuclease
VKLPAYERAGVAEVWLIHPIDRTVAIYRLEEGRYGRATILELTGHTQIRAVPTVTIDWGRVLARGAMLFQLSDLRQVVQAHLGHR